MKIGPSNFTVSEIIKYVCINIRNYGFFKVLNNEYYKEESNYCLYLDNTFVLPTRCRFAFISTNNISQSIFSIMQNHGLYYKIIESIKVKREHECYYKILIEIKRSDIIIFRESMQILYHFVYKKRNSKEYTKLCKQFIWPMCQCINKVNKKYN